MLGTSQPAPNGCALLAWLRSAPDPFYLEEDLKPVYRLFTDLSKLDPDESEAACTELLEQFLDDDRFCTYLVTTISTDANDLSPRLKLLHHPKYVPDRVGTSSPHAKKYFASIGPPVAGQFLTAEVPDLFQLETFLARTPTNIQASLLADPLLPCIDTTELVNELAANVQTLIVPTGGIWIPLQYAKLCIDHELTPAGVWHRLYPTILANGHEEACLPLLQFLQANVCHLPLSPKGITIHFPVPDVVLMKERSLALHHVQQRPAVPSPGASLPTNVTDMTSLIQAIRASTTLAPVAPTNPVPTSPEDFVQKRWAINLTTLQRVNLVTDLVQLPTVWSTLAKGPKKEERNILQAAYDELARSPTSLSNCPLVVTKELCNSVVNLSFWAGDPDRLDEGLHPFRTVYTSVQQTSHMRSLMLDYDLLASDGTVTSSDIAKFRMIFKAEYPTNFIALDATIKIFTNFVSVLLQPTHPFRMSFQTFVRAWTQASTNLAETFASDIALPAAFLRSMQLQSALYWQAVIDTTTLDAALLVPPPELVKLLYSFRLHQWLPPAMPGLPMPQPTMHHSSLPALAPPPPSRPLPAPTYRPPVAPAVNPAVTPRIRATNPQEIPAVRTAMAGRNFRIRTLLQTGAVAPLADDSTPLCLSYHTKFFCYHDCHRSSNHRPLTTAESSRLAEFVQTNVVLPDFGRDTP